MSHSNIYKLRYGYENAPYEKISVSEFERNGFLNAYHDYVEPQNEQETVNSYRWLKDASKSLFRDIESRYDASAKMSYWYADIYLEDVISYLTDATVKAKALLKRNFEALLKAPGEQQDFKLWDVANVVRGDQSGFYFYLADEYTYYTELEFAENLLRYYFNKSQFKITLRFEGALDYHC